MIRAIKIKTFTLLLSWLVIFIHGVIPHNHLSESHSDCHSIFHSTVTHDINVDDDISSEYKEHPAKEHVCHFSSFLFKFNEDHFVVSMNKETYVFPVSVKEFFIPQNTDLISSLPYYGSSSLRAPPHS